MHASYETRNVIGHVLMGARGTFGVRAQGGDILYHHLGRVTVLRENDLLGRVTTAMRNYPQKHTNGVGPMFADVKRELSSKLGLTFFPNDYASMAAVLANGTHTVTDFGVDADDAWVLDGKLSGSTRVRAAIRRILGDCLSLEWDRGPHLSPLDLKTRHLNEVMDALNDRLVEESRTISLAK